MDFAPPPVVVRALQERVAHGVFGYGNAPKGLAEAIIAHVETHNAWTLRPEWIVWLPGLVTDLNRACRAAGAVGAVGAVGDAVLTLVPIYPPFLSAPRQLITAPMMRRRGRL